MFVRSKIPAGPQTQMAVSAVVASLLLTGCDPVVNIEGAFFPAWFFCVAAGIVITAVVRVGFLRVGIEEHLFSVPLVYFCLATALSLTLWLVFYRT